jgi:starch-binding outer membrane protein, SusD/RagB family
MKSFLRKDIFVFTLCLILLSSCDKYLSETPDNRVDLNTIEKSAQLLTNAYSGAGYNFTEWMSDNVTFTTQTTKLTEHNQMYVWEDPTSVNQDTPTNFWEATYQAIAHANEVLAVIDNLEGDRNQKSAVKGEALLARAYGHFMLVNLFAKHYDEATANSDPGIPYVLEPEVTFLKKYTRNSVQEVYDFIEDDIKDGLKLVDDQYYANSGKYHFTKNAALAFASRYYLFKGDYNNCIKYSSEMLGASPTTFIKDLETLLGENLADNISTLYSAPTDPSNLLMIRNVTNFPIGVGYWPTTEQLNYIYYNSPWNTYDMRYQTQDFVFPQYVFGSGLGFAKFQFLFERSSLTSNVGLYYTIFPAFRGEEVLLNRAESYIQTNNLSAALADLQVLAQERYVGNPTITLSALKNYYGTTNSQLAALVYVIDERQKEFMHEGLRWFDIKRFGFEVTHDTADGIATLEQDDDRKILQIPQAAIDVGGLAPNPRKAN